MGTLSMPIDEAAETPNVPRELQIASPFDISPVPNIKKRTTTRGRKETRSSLITGSPYKDQLAKSLEKSAPKKTSLSVSGVRNRPGGRGGKTNGLQKKKIRPTKRYDSSSDSSDYYDPPLVNSDDDSNLDVNDRDKPDSRKATCIFFDEKFSEGTREEVWVKCVMCQMLAHLDCAGAETASFVCDFSCPPPDFPERGRYNPEYAEYEVGLTIFYSCSAGLLIYFDEKYAIFYGQKPVTCQSNGKWSGGTPFCDIPAKLRNLISSSKADSKKSLVVDGKRSTCFRIRNVTEEFLRFSLDREANPFAIQMFYAEGRSILNITFPPFKGFLVREAHIGKNEDFFSFKNYPYKTENMNIQVFPAPDSSLSLCEIELYVKDDEWCYQPPQNFIPNGQLEVSRSKAVLHCKLGFKEKDGRKVYATCENNTWSYLSLQCIGFIANAESEELREGIIDLEPLETLLQIANEKGCSVNEFKAFVNINNCIAICSQANIKALTSEFLEEKQSSSGEDSDVENIDHTPPNKTETIEALEKV
ncbi:hypothetical protein AVEN_219066-1 [Araneus ventricosus]|uniref:Sushi domain-containing protein n=1 Tax=Araneus ventricosus TaxID=182803 RepID=A0A4Y2GBZ5_ARAVE|nr:hypothetical protein AVEN_219066-1 [Araneus ventricosus]